MGRIRMGDVRNGFERYRVALRAERSQHDVGVVEFEASGYC